MWGWGGEARRTLRETYSSQLKLPKILFDLVVGQFSVSSVLGYRQQYRESGWNFDTGSYWYQHWSTVSVLLGTNVGSWYYSVCKLCFPYFLTKSSSNILSSVSLRILLAHYLGRWNFANVHMSYNRKAETALNVCR